MSTKWSQKDRQDKVLTVVGWIVAFLAGLFTLLVVIGRWIFPDDNRFYQAIDIFTWDPAKNTNLFLISLSYLLVILFLSFLLRLILDKSLCWMRRGRAAVNLLCSFIKYIAVIIVIFCILAAWGVDTTALLAGIGILSLIVGLGAQPLIEDIIAGLFIVFEKVYDVGDIIVVDGFRGKVREIGIRTTKIEDAGGDIKIMNNSDLRTLINMTSELSLAICDIQIEYSESLERVEKIIEEHLKDIQSAVPDIVEGPTYKGVAELGPSGVTLRFIAQCREDSRYQVERDINRQLKLLFDRHGIRIPFPQVVVHQADQS